MATSKKSTALKGPDAESTLAKQDFGEFAGVGMENVTQADISIAFIGILQKLSPQLDKTHEKYIKGAEEGQLFNTVTNKVIGDGSEVFIVPCCKQSVFVEWIPRDAGGGMVGIHALGSDFVTKVKANSTDQMKLRTEDKHHLVETHYVYCLLLDKADSVVSEIPIVIGFSSSKIKIYKKQLMTPIRTIKGEPPMFAFRFKVTTVDAKNAAGQPYMNFHIEPVNGEIYESVNLPGGEFEGLLVEGKALHKAVNGGTATAAHESNAEGGGGERQPGDDDEPF